MSRPSNRQRQAQRSLDRLNLLLQQAEEYRTNFANAPPAIRDWRLMTKLGGILATAHDELLPLLEYIEEQQDD